MKTLKFLIFAMLALSMCMACSKLVTPGQEAGEVEIESHDYTLQGTSCSWQYSKLKAGTVYLINSQEELSSIISCKENEMPHIDFGKYSLLLTRGGTTSGIHAFEKQLRQISLSEYSLYVDITLNATTVAQGWSISIKVPKLSPNAVVTLNINEHA
jgi:hypothetical protein